MQFQIHLDGKEQVFETNNKQVTVFELKQLISHQTGIPVRYQNMFDYREIPNSGPGLHLFADNHMFDGKILQIHLVLTSIEY